MSVNIRGKCNSCCVPGCFSNTIPSFRNRGGRITTFKLPRDEARRKEWIQAIPKRKYPPTVNHNVCILHFNEEDFSRNNRRIDLKKSAIPSIFPFVDGQKIDESSDLCDEPWTEYVAHKKDATKNRILKDVDNDNSNSASNMFRILIERLRVPGSVNFGIGTAKNTIQPDSDIETDTSESKTTAVSRPPQKKVRKSKHYDEEWATSEELNDIDMTYSQQAVEDSDSKPLEQNSVQSTISTSDNEEKFGAMVSSKLVLMSPLQRLISQKIISEILLRGQLGILKSSLSPVLVNGYMKNALNVVANTVESNFASTDCLSSMSDDQNDSGGDCDPLMCKVEPQNAVKSECCWSDDESEW